MTKAKEAKMMLVIFGSLRIPNPIRLRQPFHADVVHPGNQVHLRFKIVQPYSLQMKQGRGHPSGSRRQILKKHKLLIQAKANKSTKILHGREH